jgi:hypothetical protein
MNKAAVLCVLSGVLLAALFQCSQVTYDNPLDSRGSNYAGDTLSADDDRDGIANYYDDDDGDGIPNFRDPDYKHYQRTDFTSPVINFAGGDTVIVALNDPRGVLATATVTATDNVDGDITAKIQKPDIFTSQCSTYNVIYRVTDVAGNTAEKARTIIVDCNAPAITLRGDNPLSLRKGTAYTEPGADATDDIDGALPANRITITGTVNTTRIGFDTITYSASDRAGNAATKKRVVAVTIEPDTVAPHIVLKGAPIMTVWKDSAYVEPGYTATDNMDGDITARVVITGGPVNTRVLGSDTLTYTVADLAGNSTSQRRIIQVKEYIPGRDSLPPIITLRGAADTSIAVGSTWTEPGYTAIDNVDGDVTSKVTVREQNNRQINTQVPGSYTLLYAVADVAGNAAEVARIVRVTGQSQDTTAPVITLEGCAACSVSVGTAFTDPGVIAQDNVDGNITANVVRTVTNKASGAVVQYASFYQTVGVYNFTYTVSDKSGNLATPAVRQVTVKDTAGPGNLFAKYGVPRTSALPTVQKVYTSISTDGTGAPPVTNIKDFKLSWDLPNKGLYDFALDLNGAPYYLDLKGKITQTFGQASPAFTLTGSGVTGLDGEYYVNGDATQFVWVKKDGKYAIIFK